SDLALLQGLEVGTEQLCVWRPLVAREHPGEEIGEAAAGQLLARERCQHLQLLAAHDASSTASSSSTGPAAAELASARNSSSDRFASKASCRRASMWTEWTVGDGSRTP